MAEQQERPVSSTEPEVMPVMFVQTEPVNLTVSVKRKVWQWPSSQIPMSNICSVQCCSAPSLLCGLSGCSRSAPQPVRHRPHRLSVPASPDRSGPTALLR